MGDKILIAVVDGTVWLKKDDEGYKLTCNGSSTNILHTTLDNDEFELLNDTLLNEVEENGEIIVFKKEKNV